MKKREIASGMMLREIWILITAQLRLSVPNEGVLITDILLETVKIVEKVYFLKLFKYNS
jgi:hypothetical protein